MRVLIVEDDAMIGNSLMRGLTDAGYTADWVRDGQQAEAALQNPHNEFHVALLDWGLPGRSGIEVLRRIRRAGNLVPVLVITARDALADRVEGLDQGADDYLVKPFELAELQARIRALTRRHAARGEPPLQAQSLRLDPVTREVHCEGRCVSLTAKEYGLLHALMQRPGAVLSRGQLEARLYGWEGTIESNAIEFLLHGLRQKIGAARIRNVRGVGWRLETGA